MPPIYQVEILRILFSWKNLCLYVSPLIFKAEKIFGLLRSKDGKEFVACPGSLTNVTIPDSVTSIGNYAFSDCGNLKGVVFDGNASVVGKRVFDHVKQGCTAYVRKDSSGWNVPIPGVWNGINIEFRAAD